jgi:hypothetical protein
MKIQDAYLLVAVGIERTPTIVGINIPPNESDELVSAILSFCTDNLHSVIKNLPRVPRKPGLYRLYGEFIIPDSLEEYEEIEDDPNPKDERIFIRHGGFDTVRPEVPADSANTTD